MKSEFALAFNEVLEEKGLPREVVLAALESAMISAYRKTVGASAAQDVQVKLDFDSGNVSVFAEKKLPMKFTMSGLKYCWKMLCWSTRKRNWAIW